MTLMLTRSEYTWKMVGTTLEFAVIGEHEQEVVYIANFDENGHSLNRHASFRPPNDILESTTSLHTEHN